MSEIYLNMLNIRYQSGTQGSPPPHRSGSAGRWSLQGRSRWRRGFPWCSRRCSGLRSRTAAGADTRRLWEDRETMITFSFTFNFTFTFACVQCVFFQSFFKFENVWTPNFFHFYAFIFWFKWGAFVHIIEILLTRYVHCAAPSDLW